MFCFSVLEEMTDVTLGSWETKLFSITFSLPAPAAAEMKKNVFLIVKYLEYYICVLPVQFDLQRKGKDKLDNSKLGSTQRQKI